MFIITALENIGNEYEKTPHNAGFIFIEKLREYFLENRDYLVSD